MRLIKRMTGILLSFIIMCTSTSCGFGGKAIFTLNNVKVERSDVDIFGFMYVMEHSMVSTDELNEYFENGETYAEHYKKELEEEIVLSVLLSKEADDNGVLLSKEDENKAKDNAARLVEMFGEDRLNELNIGQEDVEKIYEMRFRGDSYAASISENYSGMTGVQLESTSDNAPEEATAAPEGEENDRYVRVFQVTFPTVVFDASGMIKTDKNGELIKVSSEEAEKMKEAAEAFAEKAKSGENIESLLKAEPKEVTGVERTLKYSDLSNDYKASIDTLSETQVSNVILSDYGYYVVKMLEKNDEEHAASIESYENQLKAVEARDELYEKLLNVYVGDDKNYRNDKLWEEVSIKSYMQ